MSLIEIKNIKKSFGTSAVLSDVSLSVQKNEIKLIMGPSGQGKSTLLRCINRLFEIDSGSIHFDGQNIHSYDMNVRLLRQNIGFVFQSFGLYRHLSILSNITLALRKLKGMSLKDAEEKALLELRRLDMLGHERKYPSQISGGQQQRVAIARALAMDPAILLLDEPTSALDPVLSRELSQLLLKLNEQSITMLCVTHDPSFAQTLTSKVAFLNHGVLKDNQSIESLSVDEDMRKFLGKREL